MALKKLIELGIEVKTNNRNVNIHDKIYANEKEALVGSFNATLSGLGSNSESGIYVADEVTHKKIWNKFQRLWDSLKETVMIE